MSEYTPPFKITPAVISLIVEISQVIERISIFEKSISNLRLRRINRVKTIKGSLAIEGNTLNESQITAILEGKWVIAPPRQIQEVKNAIKVYDNFLDWQPSSKKDLLKAHEIMMRGLIDSSGKYRTGGVGVIDDQTIIHLAPPANRLSYLMDALLGWVKTTDYHPLIASSVFHYEFEFIHPFEDGNGRMGRLWQTLILSKWNPLFATIPVESLVFENQEEYYRALSSSTTNAECSIFIEFMLRMICNAAKSLLEHLNTPEVNPEVTPEVKKMLYLLLKGDMSRKEIQLKLGLKDEKHFREAYIKPVSASGLIEMTIPDKPNSRLQKYRITPKGQAYLSIL
ncbi:MAG: Fic family protein [Desulfamplus sp.]|nr:Fic family protein [Desulfamplus sp.]